jgi:hypothetical protein
MFKIAYIACINFADCVMHLITGLYDKAVTL